MPAFTTVPGAALRSGTAPTDLYGLPLTTSPEAAAAYNRGVRATLMIQQGSVNAISESIVHDPTFALGHAALALLGHLRLSAGERDQGAAATAIYARAYGKVPGLFEFMKSMETLHSTLDEKAWLVLSTDSDLLKYLKGSGGR